MMLWSAAPPAPNPRRVTIFAAEKGLTLPVTELAVFRGEQKSPGHLARNPRGQVPALELDDGTVIAESISICRYLDALHPDPPLFGLGALDRALVDVALRRVENVLGVPLALVWVNDHPLTAAAFGSAFRDFGASNRPKVDAALRWFDGQLTPFAAGPAFTVADIALWCSLDFAQWIGIAIPPDCRRLRAWFAAVAARPSVVATGGPTPPPPPPRA